MKSLLRRSSNIELLRILLMTSIVFWHLLVHGIGLIHQDFYHDVDSYKVFLYCLAPFFSFAVNCFFFISGFYGIKLTLNKFLSFLVQAFIYTLFTSFVINITTGEYSFRMLWSIVSNSFPFASNGLWFLVAYIYLMMLSPVFNYGFDAINNKEKKQKVIRSILFCLFVCSVCRWLGESETNNYLNAFCIYLLGLYFRRNPPTWLIDNCYFIFLLVCITLLSLSCYNVFVQNMNVLSFRFLTNYSNPLIILGSVSIFYSFYRLKIGHIHFINHISAGVFASYLLTDGLLRDWFNYNVCVWFERKVLYLLLFSIFFVIFVSIIDLLRRKCTDKIIDYLAIELRKIIVLEIENK